MSELAPPRKSVELEDPGAHELDSSDDSFTDASEGQKAPSRSADHSPVPITRVERVDDKPSYGEVPGTSAYKLRTQDAVPDEIEVVPEGMRSRSASRINPDDRPVTPGGTFVDVPKIVAEKIEPEKPAYGDVPGTTAYEMRKADAVPDEIVKSPQSTTAPPNPFSGSPTSSKNRSSASLDHTIFDDNEESSAQEEEEDEEGFGDDFDDFEEGQDADDFGEFDNGPTESEAAFESPGPPPVLSPQQPSIPVLDFSELEYLADIQSACEPYLNSLFPSYPPTSTTDHPKPSQQTFLSDRSLSLYTQLIAPPPLAPPNWLRSRIRRLFLVSLGVPVDLDEILPASKQKKLVLPSIHLRPSIDDRSPRPSLESPVPTIGGSGGPINKLKNANDSSTSLGSSASRKGGKRKTGQNGKESPVPDFDASDARRLGQTTEVRLGGMNDEELTDHVKELEAWGEKAREALGFWERRCKEAGREKEAFEGVIENLVSFARKVRK